MNNTPDFSMRSKRRIAEAVKKALSTPADFTDARQPSGPRGGLGGPTGNFRGQALIQGETTPAFDWVRLRGLLPGDK